MSIPLQRPAALFAALLLVTTMQAQPVDLPIPPQEAASAPQAILGARTPCANGTAAGYACRDVDLMALLPIVDMGGDTQFGASGLARLNDIWGWTDPQTGREYALVGRTDGTAFVDVTLPESPAFLGLLPRTSGSAPTTWRDIKVYADHAFVVSEANGHGMQVFDLTQLRGLAPDPNRTFAQAGHYSRISRAHNLVINEASGFAYAVGSVASGVACGPGLHMIDIRTPTAPTFAGCFTDPATGRSGNGYTHDAQCVIYQGPDSRYTGREICFAANETAISLADVTDKAAPQKIASISYPNVAYAHQGWLSEDQRYFFVDDELDESGGRVNKTRTLVFDLLQLDSPMLINQHLGQVNTIDHNQYVVERYSFQANYTSGLRILDVSNPASLSEVAFFDTFPQADSPTSFLGLWSVYPFFASRTVIASDITGGLFVLRPTTLALSTNPELPPAQFALRVPRLVTGEATIDLDLPEARTVRVALYDVSGRQVALLADEAFGPGIHTLTLRPDALANGTYFVRATSSGGAETGIVTLLR